jgi:hypothetical protein
MTPFSFVLFLHVTAVLSMFATLSFEALSLFRLRHVSSLAEAHVWLEAVPRLPLIAIGSLVFVFFSGVYLVVQMSLSDYAWPKVTVGAILLILPLGALSGKRMRSIRRACADAKSINSELITRLRDPLFKISLGVRIAVLLGIVLLMSATPELWESISIIGISVVLGFLSSLLVGRRHQSLSAPSADLGDK